MDAEILKILACPWCVTRPVPGTPKLARAKLEVIGPADNPTGLKCKDCERVYAVKDGLPDLIVENATKAGK